MCLHEKALLQGGTEEASLSGEKYSAQLEIIVSGEGKLGTVCVSFHILKSAFFVWTGKSCKSKTRKVNGISKWFFACSVPCAGVLYHSSWGIYESGMCGVIRFLDYNVLLIPYVSET